MTITVEELHRLFDADFEAGVLKWKVSPSKAVKAGAEAGGQHNRGYRHISLKNKKLLVHRVLWAMATGSFPENDIDHINGIRNDNRLCNLRPVTRTQNMQNQAISRANRTGHTGVYYMEATGKWRASIRNKHIGLFDTIEGAATARKAANIAYGYHENHGRQVSA